MAQDKQLKKKDGTLSEEQISLIKNTVAKGATNDELKLFLYQAQRTGLDPLAKQIYFVKRAGIATIQTSIDGFRIIAERSGLYAGQDEPVFAEDKDGKPIRCEVAVYKFSPNGQRYKAAVGVAYWNEYKPPIGQDFMWNKMPHVMLSKVAESIALRKAFPQDLSGIYTDEEMEQSGQETGSITVMEEKSTPEKTQTVEFNIVTPKQRAMIQHQRDRIGMSNDELLALSDKLGINPSKMSRKEASQLIKTLMETEEKNY